MLARTVAHLPNRIDDYQFEGTKFRDFLTCIKNMYCLDVLKAGETHAQHSYSLLASLTMRHRVR